MQPASLPRRFLLRASALLVVLLGFWWFALQGLLLTALDVAAAIPFRVALNGAITIEPSGDWSFHIPVKDSPSGGPRRPGSPESVDSFDFTIPVADIATFTVGLPIYWAVGLAATRRPHFSALALGSLVQLAVGVVSLMLFAEVTAYNALASVRADPSAFSHWVRELTAYLVTNVVPYATPLIAAVWLHPDLRGPIFAPPAVAR